MAGGRRKHQPPPAPPRPSNTIVLDHGGSTLKAGLVQGSSLSESDPRIIPNLIARDGSKHIYVASEIEKCKNFAEIALRRPVEKGFVVSWEVQKEIWEREVFNEDGKGKGWKIDPSDTRMVIAEPSNGLPILQGNCDQIVFEEYGFSSYARVNGPACNAYHDIQKTHFCTETDTSTAASIPAQLMLVVDSGYSSTTITPVFRGRPLHSAVRRLDIGGRFLTNYLARLISIRHFDVSTETYAINEMKEKACYVTSDFSADLEVCWKGTRGDSTRSAYKTGGGIAKDYILPDYHSRFTGELVEYDPARHSRVRKLAAAGQTQEDFLTLRNERFTVPEVLFRPSDVGWRQPGLADLIRQSLDEVPLALWPGLLANVAVVGGNAQLDGFVRRLQKEVLQGFPSDCSVRVASPKNPVVSTWQGAAHLATHANMEKLVVTKKEYEEHGGAWVARKFALGMPLD